MKRVICWLIGHKFRKSEDGVRTVWPYCLRCGRCPDGCGEEDEVKKMSPKIFREFAELSLKNYRQRMEREEGLRPHNELQKQSPQGCL